MVLMTDRQTYVRTVSLSPRLPVDDKRLHGARSTTARAIVKLAMLQTACLDRSSRPCSGVSPPLIIPIAIHLHGRRVRWVWCRARARTETEGEPRIERFGAGQIMVIFCPQLENALAVAV